MSSYGWTLNTVFSHTLYQLDCLYVSITQRVYDDYIMKARISRISQADNKGFAEFVSFLEKARNPVQVPRNPKGKATSGDKPVVPVVPVHLEGFRVVN